MSQEGQGLGTPGERFVFPDGFKHFSEYVKVFGDLSELFGQEQVLPRPPVLTVMEECILAALESMPEYVSQILAFAKHRFCHYGRQDLWLGFIQRVLEKQTAERALERQADEVDEGTSEIRGMVKALQQMRTMGGRTFWLKDK